MNEKLNNVEWSFTQETGCLTITGTGKSELGGTSRETMGRNQR